MLVACKLAIAYNFYKRLLAIASHDASTKFTGNPQALLICGLKDQAESVHKYLEGSSCLEAGNVLALCQRRYRTFKSIGLYREVETPSDCSYHHCRRRYIAF
jgi:hypothetical protein